MEKINILAIETSCDETSAAVVQNGRRVLSNAIHSQIDIHRKYGGVVPEIASRNHIVKVDEVVAAALDEAKMRLQDLSTVAVTYGPGLVGALLVGLNFGKALAFATDLPIIGVHHIAGHIASNYLENEDFAPPYIALVVSGGHTLLVHVKDYCQFEVLGKSLDDAAGEAYDKVARSLGLPYPGGIEIDRLASQGNSDALNFPRAYLAPDSLDFSFSGIKSAVLNHLNSTKMSGGEINAPDIAASFQEAVVDVLSKKAIAACKTAGVDKLAISGGVAANSRLRAVLGNLCRDNSISLNIPAPIFCTDNAAMIASAAYFQYREGKFSSLNINAVPNLPL